MDIVATSPLDRMRSFIKPITFTRTEDDKKEDVQQNPADLVVAETYKQSTLQKSISTLIQQQTVSQQQKAEDLVDELLTSYALQQGIDLQTLKWRLEQEAQLEEQPKESKEEEPSAQGPKGGLLKSVVKFVAGKLIGSVAKAVIFNILRTLIRSVVVGGLRFLGALVVRYLVVGLASAVGAVLSTLGLPLVLGGLAIGGVGYVLYKKFFADAPNETAAPPTEEAQKPTIGRWIARFLGIKVRDEVHTANNLANANEAANQTQQAVTISSAASNVTLSAAAKKSVENKLALRTPSVAEAIHTASLRVGESEPILTAFAFKESAFNPNAGASTSSAKGLFQFISSTWVTTKSKYGAQYGVPGNASIYDPLANAIMGAAYLKHDVRPQIQQVVSNPSATDLYFGHFLGPAGGKRFLQGYYSNPNDLGINWVQPSQANANRSIFYKVVNGGLVPRTLQEIYSLLSGSLSPIETYVAQQQVGTTSTASTPVKDVDAKVASVDMDQLGEQATEKKVETQEASKLAGNPNKNRKDYIKVQRNRLIAVG